MNQERRDQIVDMITQKRTVKNTELMERFGVSIETVRRDLEHLEQQGYLERVYGGAVLKTSLGSEPSYVSREKQNHHEKTLIAAEAAKMVFPDEAIFIDLGTTGLMLAQCLKKISKLTVFTNALRTAIVLSESRDCEVMMPGGRVRPQELALSGFPAESNMRQFNIDKAFIGVGGITEDGVTDFHIAEASLRRQMIENARQVIALADHGKFGIRAMNNVCRIEDIDILVTDEKAPGATLKRMEHAGVKVIIAKE